MDVPKKDIGSCHLILYDLAQPVMLHIGFKLKSNLKKKFDMLKTQYENHRKCAKLTHSTKNAFSP